MITTKEKLKIATVEWTVPNPKAVLTLTHGFGEHSARYAHVGAQLNAAGYSLYAYDLRGHGRSDGPRGHTPSYDHLLDDLSRVITRVKQHVNNPKIFVYGHSMGGNITLSYALLRPMGLAGCIVTGPWLRRAIEAPAWQLALGRFMARVAPGFTQKTPTLAGLLTRDGDIEAIAKSDPLNHRSMSARLFVDISAAAEHLLANAGKFKLPLFIGHGANDRIIAPSGSDQFFSAVGSQDKTLKVYDGFEHEIHNEIGGEAFVNDMIAWLDKRAGAHAGK